MIYFYTYWRLGFRLVWTTGWRKSPLTKAVTVNQMRWGPSRKGDEGEVERVSGMGAACGPVSPVWQQSRGGGRGQLGKGLVTQGDTFRSGETGLKYCPQLIGEETKAQIDPITSNSLVNKRWDLYPGLSFQSPLSELLHNFVLLGH